MNNAVARNKKQITIGLDLGDRRHTYCVLDEAGKIAREGSLSNTREQLAAMAGSYPGATVVMEAGTHSPWVSRFLQELGLRAVVANPRKTRAIYENERKSDRRDAMMLARLARLDPTLLHPIEHGQEAQQDMLQLKLRDSLVRARVALINAVRFTLKSLGYPVSNPLSERFHKLVRDVEVLGKERVKETRPKKSEPPHPFAEVPCGSGQHQIELIALETFEEAAQEPKVLFEMTNDRLDCRATTTAFTHRRAFCSRLSSGSSSGHTKERTISNPNQAIIDCSELSVGFRSITTGSPERSLWARQ